MSKEVELVLLPDPLLHNHGYLSTECVYFCHLCVMVKDALINIFILSVDYVKSVARSDKSRDNYQPALHFPSGLWSILVSDLALLLISHFQLQQADVFSF